MWRGAGVGVLHGKPFTEVEYPSALPTSINALVFIARGRLARIFLHWIGALNVRVACEGRTSDHAWRCARGKEEEGTGCRGHFERPTRCAFWHRVGRELEHNVAYATTRRPRSSGLSGGLLHKSLLCYVASGRPAWRKGACAALAHPSCCVCVGQVMGAPAGTRTRP